MWKYTSCVSSCLWLDCTLTHHPEYGGCVAVPLQGSIAVIVPQTPIWGTISLELLFFTQFESLTRHSMLCCLAYPTSLGGWCMGRKWAMAVPIPVSLPSSSSLPFSNARKYWFSALSLPFWQEPKSMHNICSHLREWEPFTLLHGCAQ